jgi:hypothetical protein
MKIIYLLFLWILYFTLHSLFASDIIKNYIKNKMGVIFRFYRIFYNLFAIGSIIPILVYHRRISSLFYFQKNVLTSTLGYFIIVISVVLCVITFKKYSIERL